jgi:signal transduction histidine kinase/phage shock protein PspC (stress-responsive transcriptional regulator)
MVGPMSRWEDRCIMSDTQLVPRRAYRSDERLLGGVAKGLAEHLGLDPLAVRLGFLLLAPVALFGFVLYVVMWALLPSRDLVDVTRNLPPGTAAATRRGMRGRVAMSRRDAGLAASVVTCGVGAAFLLQALGLGIRSSVFWPAVVAAAGLVLVWVQVDEVERSAVLGVRRWQGWLRVASGLALIVGAVVIVLLQAGRVTAIGSVVGVLLLAVAGTLLVVGPWFVRLWRDLQDERAERVRTQERADVAAHLHDSVLQTLALIQRRSGDPKAVAALARTQERELRDWLYTAAGADPTTLRAALREAANEVETAHTMPVEVVVVGDVLLDEHVSALVRASREAMLNAAKHSGDGRVDVYAEVTMDAVDVFVRDRGRGFDPDEVPPDRMGVRGSMLGRMARHGGSVTIASVADQGTEIRLQLPLGSRPKEDA